MWSKYIRGDVLPYIFIIIDNALSFYINRKMHCAQSLVALILLSECALCSPFDVTASRGLQQKPMNNWFIYIYIYIYASIRQQTMDMLKN